MRRTLFLVLASGLVIMGNAQSEAAQCEDPKAGKLSLTGTATVTETPDTAKVYLSVSVTKPTAEEARKEAGATTDAVLAAVGGVEGINGDTDVSTSDISLQPNYVWVQDTNSNRVTGYVFTQSITVKISNLTSDTLGEVVDTAVKAGGNNLQVSSIQIDLSTGLRRQAMDLARKLAVEDAASTAQILADAAKVTLGPLKSITDSNVASPTPVYMGGAEMANAAMPVAASAQSTPVKIGTTDVTATVNVEYAYLNK